MNRVDRPPLQLLDLKVIPAFRPTPSGEHDPPGELFRKREVRKAHPPLQVTGSAGVPLQHPLGQLGASCRDGVERRSRGLRVSPIILVQDRWNHRQIGRGDALALVIVAIVEMILTPLDHGVPLTIGYQQMGALLGGDGDGHCILL